jgi:hypothetical protein
MRFMPPLLVLLAIVLFLIWIESSTCKRYMLVKKTWTGHSYFMCEENVDPRGMVLTGTEGSESK